MVDSTDPSGFDLLSRTEAVDRLLALRAECLTERPATTAPIDRIAGRTVAESIDASRDLPARSQATMDGYALDTAADYPLTVVGERFPESDSGGIEKGEAVRIATGAPLPEGTDAVLRRERAAVEDGRLTGPSIEPGTNVYEHGSNVAGGERIFEKGERLAAPDAILLRDLGIEPVPVHEPLSVGVLATGTEIHEGRSPDRDSPTLAALVREWSHEATLEGSVPDELGRVRERIADLAAVHDVVLTSGGTSLGRKDHAVAALRELGEVVFHGVGIRPGKPVAVADLDGAVALAVPGKPIAALTAARAVLEPFFTGQRREPTLEATLARDLALGGDLEYWVPVSLSAGEGLPEAMPYGHADSPLALASDRFPAGRVASSTRAARADGAAVLGSDAEAGDRVAVHPYR
ncbi:molybdopterin molybdotransferase MoeA [Saliphagus sp. LR7]|uniref:molybdopterin molybdotransferase MoeA n=1 Tax=Saliphagus sp. LR7 TaxID=2282654 RepID=UPI000DF7EBD2|nr:molybdopterin molybdotransferase MoeA [Saliphagus sp. LR7]